jgi:hypothetical protein
MKRIALLALSILLGCVMPPKLTEPLRLSRNFAQDYDRVWQEAVRMIAREGFIITATDKSSGLISYSIRLAGEKVKSLTAEASSFSPPYRAGAAIIQVLVESQSPKSTKVTLFSRLNTTYIDFWTGRETTTELISNGELEKDFFTKLSNALGEGEFEFIQPGDRGQSSTIPKSYSLGVFEDDPVVEVPEPVRKAFAAKLNLLLPQKEALQRDLQIRYRFVQYDPGNQFLRFLFTSNVAGTGVLTVEAKYFDAYDKALATIHVEGKTEYTFPDVPAECIMGCPFELAIQKAAKKLAEYTWTNFVYGEGETKASRQD